MNHYAILLILRDGKQSILKKKISLMKTKKMNFKERLETAQRNINWFKKELCRDLIRYGEKSASVEWDLIRLKYWTKYVINTCEMHDYKIDVLLL